jgi:hypothetical protein
MNKSRIRIMTFGDRLRAGRKKPTHWRLNFMLSFGMGDAVIIKYL